MIAAFLLKAPVPGLVKTRLATDLGNEAACSAYRKLVMRQIEAIPSDWKIHVFYTPQDAAAIFQDWLGPSITYTPQPDGDLGNRQQAAVEACQPDPVALIGGDCPYLTADILKQVAAGLGSHDLSIVPAVDGGYVTLAMKQWHPGLFDGIAWSTETVAPKLYQNANALNVSLKTFNPLVDIDTIHEWQTACETFPELTTTN